MGEIIVSVLIGGLLVVSGLTMNFVLGREEKLWKSQQDSELSAKK